MPPRQARTSIIPVSVPFALIGSRSLLPLLAAGCLLAGGDVARAQGRVDAQYEVTLAGIPIGKGSWVVDIADEQYSALAQGKTTGLIAVMSTGDGNGGSQGRV